jgi:hypothetical protein
MQSSSDHRYAEGTENKHQLRPCLKMIEILSTIDFNLLYVNIRIVTLTMVTIGTVARSIHHLLKLTPSPNKWIRGDLSGNDLECVKACQNM